MCFSGILAAGSLIGGLASSSAASDAANAQVAAANQATDLQREMYYNNLDLVQPWLASGQNALNAYNYELGLAPMPTEQTYTIDTRTVEVPGTAQPVQGYVPSHAIYDYQNYDANGLNQIATAPTTETQYWVNDQQFDTYDAAQDWINAQPSGYYTGFEATPSYQFQLDEAIKAAENYNSARGMSLSGAATEEVLRLGSGYAANEYNNYLNRLAGASGMGQSAANTAGSYGINYANQAGQNYMAAGDASASGFINSSNALNSTLGDMSSILMMGQMGLFS